MGMREYSGSGYLADLRFLKNYNKNETFSIEEIEELKRKVKILGLEEMWDEYLKDNEESYSYNFYDYLYEFYLDSGHFTVFSDEDNPEDFEFGVLYKYFSDEDLYVKTKTKLHMELDELGIDFEFGNYGFWG